DLKMAMGICQIYDEFDAIIIEQLLKRVVGRNAMIGGEIMCTLSIAVVYSNYLQGGIIFKCGEVEIGHIATSYYSEPHAQSRQIVRLQFSDHHRGRSSESAHLLIRSRTSFVSPTPAREVNSRHARMPSPGMWTGT